MCLIVTWMVSPGIIYDFIIFNENIAHYIRIFIARTGRRCDDIWWVSSVLQRDINNPFIRSMMGMRDLFSLFFLVVGCYFGKLNFILTQNALWFDLMIDRVEWQLYITHEPQCSTYRIKKSLRMICRFSHYVSFSMLK